MNDDVKIASRAGSVGVVATQTVTFDRPLRFEAGGEVPSFTVAYETYGRLNEDRSNAILICHALSGDAHVAGYHTEDPAERPGWWDEAVGPGRMFDTNRFFVICSNVIGGCSGSTGPSSLASDGKPYGLRFPITTIKDMVAAQAALMDHLGIQRLYATAGGSMGAMQALQWALDYPERVGSVLFIASTARSSTQNVALNAIGREAIMRDANFRSGDYYGHTPPRDGLAVARMVGHISYMSEYSLERKFARNLHVNGAGPHRWTFDIEYAVESYLNYQGEKFVNRFDANSYLYITKALDYFDIAVGHASLTEAMAPIWCPVLVVSFSSDWLYPAAHSEALVQALVAAGKHCRYYHVVASYGHDSFLVEVETMAKIVGGFLEQVRERD
jgi:homoserine O-acetyltransferase